MILAHWLKSLVTRNRSWRRGGTRLDSPLRRRKRFERLAVAAETLEQRTLLTGPELIAIAPNLGGLLVDGQTYNRAPQELVLRFSEGQAIDASTLGAITIRRAGHDGVISPNDPVVVPGFIGIGNRPNEVIIRFSGNLPDDQYRIEIKGTGTAPLRNTLGQAFNSGVDRIVQFNLDLGSQIEAVVPQPVLRDLAIEIRNPATIIDGDQFTIRHGDGGRVFEFDNNGSVTAGAIAIALSPGETAAALATKIQAAINSATGGTFDVTASVASRTRFDANGMVEGVFTNVVVRGGSFSPTVKLTVAVPNAARLFDDGLQHKTDRVVVHFTPTDPISATLATQPGYYRLIDVKTGAIRLPQQVVFHSLSNKAILLFGASLPAGTWSLQVGANPDAGTRLTEARRLGTLFNTASFVANEVLGDKLGANDVDLYQFDVVAPNPVNITVSPQAGLEVTIRIFDAAGNALHSVSSSSPGAVTALSILISSPGKYYVGISSSGNNNYNVVDGSGAVGGSGTGSYKIEITTPTSIGLDDPFFGRDTNSTFQTIAGESSPTDLGNLGAAGQFFTREITPIRGIQLPLEPGSNDEPGHRHIPVDGENHTALDGLIRYTPDGIPVINYNFSSFYGFDPQGNPLFNLITENQKQRAREIFEIISALTGVRFEESDIDVGIHVVTGDLRAVDPTVPTGPGGVGGIANGHLAVMDSAENWGNSEYGGAWFQTAFHEIMHNLGLGHSYDLPSIMGEGLAGEPVFPGDHDLTHLRQLYPRQINDIDLYKFTVEPGQAGRFRAETFAERRVDGDSGLDTVLTLYREITLANGTKTYQLIARNDNYFGVDSFIELNLDAGVYFVGVSAVGNDDYNPNVANSGSGGRRSGTYDLKLSLDVPAGDVLRDTTATGIDGDSDGRVGGVHTFSFNVGETIFVDAAGRRIVNGAVTDTGNGTLANPFKTIGAALSSQELTVTATGGTFTLTFSGDTTEALGANATAADIQAALQGLMTVGAGNVLVSETAPGSGVFRIVFQGALRNADVPDIIADGSSLTGGTASVERTVAPGTIVRIVGNGGADGDPTTVGDNTPYLIGLNESLQPLADGADFQIPRDVTVMIDGDAVLKLRRAVIEVGSGAQGLDRSGGVLQVLGTPGHDVQFTSYRDDSVGGNSDDVSPGAFRGDWGGIIFRSDSDFDNADANNDGVRGDHVAFNAFLNTVNHATFRYGGGTVFVDGDELEFAPIYLSTSRPTITFNTIVASAGAAISADPNSFADSLDRLGPKVYGNRLSAPELLGANGLPLPGNSLNGMFIRSEIRSNAPLDELTVSARFDDTDIVHIIAQNLIIDGGPGVVPAVGEQQVIDLAGVIGGSFRLTLGSETTGPIAFSSDSGVLASNIRQALESLDAIQPSDVLVINLGNGRFRIDFLRHQLGVDLPQLVADSTGLIGGSALVSTIQNGQAGIRKSGRLHIDPGIIVKLSGSRIETELGTRSGFIAEASASNPIIFTSIADDRYGAGGVFDTTSDANASTPAAGDWGGLVFNALSYASIDRALIKFAGGVTPDRGDFFEFNPIEIHQANVRVSNSFFTENASGVGPAGISATRNGRGFNTAATIFVRGAQPVIVNNIFTNNGGAVVSVDVNSLNAVTRPDLGRMTGVVEVFTTFAGNYGPLVRLNRMDGNQTNGMEIRGGLMTTAGVWDDTDIAHVVRSEIIVPNFHTFGGLRLQSDTEQSLVVKLSGPTAGFTASGSELDIDDRIGGSVHIVGAPGRPVVLTSLFDSTIGAGLKPDGTPLTVTEAGTPSPGDWRGIRFDEHSNDRNVAVIIENERPTGPADINRNPTDPQVQNLGELAAYIVNPSTGQVYLAEKSGDENRRLGFEVHGAINFDNPNDFDVYSFRGVAGTEVWFDIDATDGGLATILELINNAGQVIALAVYDPVTGQLQLRGQTVANGVAYNVLPLTKDPVLGDDYFTVNPNDAGMRLILPGSGTQSNQYYVRVRSVPRIYVKTDSNGDGFQDGLVGIDRRAPVAAPGSTSGRYVLKVRVNQRDDVPGSTVRFADIRYATNGIEVIGLPRNSPLTGEAGENENPTGAGANDTSGSAQNVGNVMESNKGAISISGRIGTPQDVDFYEFSVNYVGIQQIPGASNDTVMVPVVIDLDYADGMGRANTRLAIYDSTGRLIFVSRDSNLGEDQSDPTTSHKLEDLDRGSQGRHDPAIGPIMLPVGTYYLAVYNELRIPQVLNQTLQAAANNPLVRLEPLDSINRIAEEHLGGPISTAENPQVALFNPVNAYEENVIPYHLGDVYLFVSRNGNVRGGTGSSIEMVNPFTGQRILTVGGFGRLVGDIAMRPDGELFAYTTRANTGNPNDGNTGNYLQIDTGSGNSTQLGDDGITTFGPTGNPPQLGNQNSGLNYQAMAYSGTDDDDGYAVAHRYGSDGDAIADDQNNILYRFNSRTGVAINQATNQRGAGPPDTRQAGAGTNIVEVGIIDTSTGLGGTITGLAVRLGSNIGYAVDDQGGLYRVNLGNASTTFIGAIPGGTGFASLDFAPGTVEGGIYQDVLIGITSSGTLIAFRTDGTLAPIFYHGQSSVDTGISGVHGLAFGTLQRNLWHTTGHRDTDPGHGLVVPVTGSRDAEDGGTSFYFGSEVQSPAAGNKNNMENTLVRNYNFPGGAHGSLVTGEFDLEGYSASDRPVLYFNYYLETENATYAYTTPDTKMRDSFRVYIAGDDGNWRLLATNNSLQDLDRSDEFDYNPFFADSTANGSTDFPYGRAEPYVQELFDNTGNWRQARIDLSAFAGMRNLRLRFDFATAGSLDVGNIMTQGEHLRTLHAAQLRDGQTLTFTNSGTTGPTTTFEIDLGATIIAHSGAAIADGATFTINDGVNPPVTFEFDKNGTWNAANHRILITDNLSPNEVALAILGALQSSGLGLNVYRNDPDGSPWYRVNVQSVDPSATLTFTTNGLPAGFVQGQDGVAAGNIRVRIHQNMTREEVALALRQALADVYSNGDITNIKGHRDLIYVIGHSLLSQSAGPFSGTAFGIDKGLPYENMFGAANIGYASNRPAGSLRGLNNAHEGVYIDDLIIGFAERGEMVTSAPANTSFIANFEVTNPQLPRNNQFLYNPITVGEYQVEIRRGMDYGVFGDASPGSSVILGLLESFDTNERFAGQTRLTVSGGWLVRDGSIFTISDGIRDVEFEFVDVTARPNYNPPNGPGLTPRIAIYYSLSTPANTLALSIRQAINSAFVQNVLRGVTAQFSTGTTIFDFDFSNEGAESTNLIDLFGVANVTVTPAAASAVTAVRTSRDNYNLPSYGDPTVFGDQNQHRDQGQIIIERNQITHSSQWGIVVDAGGRDGDGNPIVGTPRNTSPLNNDRLAPGVVIVNNVLAFGGDGGLTITGEANGSNALAAVPFARVVNNTIYGNVAPTGTGVRIQTNSAATLLNNIVSGFDVGISVDGSSLPKTVVGTTVFKDNNSNGTTGSNAILLGSSEPLFVDPANGNFYLSFGSRAIDSSLNGLLDRPNSVVVKDPLGIPASHIAAPPVDLFGQTRSDDPNVDPPPGLGSNVFFDRGAIERADFTGPSIVITSPADNSGGDLDPAPSVITLNRPNITQITFQLVDTGIGILDSSVVSDAFTLTHEGTPLVAGQDYLFSYNSNTKVVTLTSTTGQFAYGQYEVVIDNDAADPGNGDLISGVSDQAGNFVRPNRAGGLLAFTMIFIPPPQITVSDATIVEGDNGQQNMVFTVTLSSDPGVDVTVDYETTDNSATAGLDYLPVSGTLTFTTGGPLQQQIVVPILGDLLPEQTETLFLNLSNASAAVELADVLAIGTITDNDIPSVTVSDAVVVEGDGPGTKSLVFTLTLSKSVSVPVTVEFTASPLTATEGEDYVPVSGVATIAPNQMTGTISIPIIGDSLIEPNEELEITLSNAVNANLIRTTALGTIIDDDTPTILIEDVGVLESSGFAQFRVTLSKPVGVDVFVEYATSSGTATGAGVDYQTVSGVLQFTPGQTVQFINVPIVRDAVAEPLETFTVVLSNPFNAILDRTTAIGRIIDGAFATGVVVAPNAGFEPLVKVYDSQGTSLRFPQFYAYDPSFRGGVRVAVGDISGDGVADIVTAPVRGAQPVRVFDGKSGALLRSFFPYDPSFTGGYSLALGDINGDGRDEIFVGIASLDAAVRVFDGRVTDDAMIINGIERNTSAINRIISSYYAFAGGGFTGGVNIALGDVTGDGALDLIVGIASQERPAVRILNPVSPSANPVFYYDFYTFHESYRGGINVAAGDVNGDGRAELIVGMNTSSSAVRVFDLTLPYAIPRNPAIGYPGLPGMLSAFEAFGGFTGGVNVGVTDRNFDGRVEVIATPASNSTPAVRFFNPNNGVVLGFLNPNPFPTVTSGGWVAGETLDLTGLPLKLEGQVATSSTEPAVTQAQVEALAAAAIERLAAGGASDEIVDRLKSVQIVVADLPGSYLGLAQTGTVVIDINAGGHGWFVDSTPDLDEEFHRGDDGVYRAVAAQAKNKVDLLTVITHELAHQFGLGDLNPTIAPNSLMTGSLPTAVRRATKEHVDDLFADSELLNDLLLV